MQRVIGVTELQRRFRAVLDEVANNKVQYVLTRSSRPEAVIISYEEFLRWQAMQEQEILSNFDQLTERMAHQNAAIDEADLIAEIESSRDELTK
ncbi:MAG: type II toxin-antitoxin system Phd/YefM family antitoxin [Anaerolineae bacterium]|nr:type II toxin-antitoxin system Phd/YefM family antitoxin [Anaerolineae bacterium]